MKNEIFFCKFLTMNSVTKPSDFEIKSLYNYFVNKNYYEAEKLSITFTKKFPNFQFGWKMLGVIHLQNGLFDKALIANIKSHELVNNDHEAAYNLGINYQNLNELDKAFKYYSLAININPNYPEAFNNLGIISINQNNFEEAFLNYKQAIKLKPNFYEAFYNLGNCLKYQNKFKEAILNYAKAIELNPYYQAAYYNWLVLIEEENLLTNSVENHKIVSNLLDIKNLIRPSFISKMVCLLVKNKIDLNYLQIQYLNNKISITELLIILSNTKLLIKFMSLGIISDIEIEKFLKFIRKEVLLRLLELNFNDEIKIFQIALANQCFINEYIYYRDSNESEKIIELTQKVQSKVKKNIKPSISEILCLLSYNSLQSISWLDISLYHKDLIEIYKRQIIEPEKENKIKKDILILNNDINDISSKVKNQYEESPYPRWINLSLPSNSKSLYGYSKEKQLNIPNENIFKIIKPNILIAGCGTGQHSIEMAKTISNCEVLAIDLSLNSLSYAKRKSQELNIKNIDYAQADILSLDKLNRNFDIIDSVGVLHHMEKPIDGLKCLIRSLNNYGLMRIGLYSEVARSNIIKTQKEIKKNSFNLTLNEMILFRESIIKSTKSYHQELLSINDFYSLSEFRDLLFNVKEHRFNLNQIKNTLDSLGLNFCGFENQLLITKFIKNSNNKNDIYDLDLWHQFEQSEKDSFIEMYVFWCQKK